MVRRISLTVLLIIGLSCSSPNDQVVKESPPNDNDAPTCTLSTDHAIELIEEVTDGGVRRLNPVHCIGGGAFAITAGDITNSGSQVGDINVLFERVGTRWQPVVMGNHGAFCIGAENVGAPLDEMFEAEPNTDYCDVLQ